MFAIFEVPYVVLLEVVPPELIGTAFPYGDAPPAIGAPGARSISA